MEKVFDYDKLPEDQAIEIAEEIKRDNLEKSNQYYPKVKADERDKEDARRLYVAISRTKKRLMLSHYNRKYDKNGRAHFIGTSPFIECIRILFNRN